MRQIADFFIYIRERSLNVLAIKGYQAALNVISARRGQIVREFGNSASVFRI